MKFNFRNAYSFLLCTQECVICKSPINYALPICEECIKNNFDKYLDMHFKNPEKFCSLCGRFLISEQNLCTSCSQSDEKEKKYYDKIFVLFPYQGIAGTTLTQWKNLNQRVFSDFFSDIIFTFISKENELQKIPIVPVPPRPKKMQTKGWDQIDDLSKGLETKYNLNILKVLKRQDGVSQKSLSSERRKTNLVGKISVQNKKIILPEILIVLDDVMTTGSTLNYCAKELKENGCKKVYGFCLFFD